MLLYLIGFWAPWTWTRGTFAPPASTAWLALSTTLARWNWLRIDQATLLVTVMVILCGFLGGILRVWGTAYLGASTVHAGPMQAGSVMAGGPYRYVRNPLYLGSMFLAASIAVLMPPSGAVVFLLAAGLFYFRLILGEEAFLGRERGGRLHDLLATGAASAAHAAAADPKVLCAAAMADQRRGGDFSGHVPALSGSTGVAVRSIAIDPLPADLLWPVAGDASLSTKETGDFGVIPASSLSGPLFRRSCQVCRRLPPQDRRLPCVRVSPKGYSREK